MHNTPHIIHHTPFPAYLLECLRVPIGDMPHSQQPGVFTLGVVGAVLAVAAGLAVGLQAEAVAVP